MTVMNREIPSKLTETVIPECTISGPGVEDQAEWAALYKEYSSFTGAAMNEEKLRRVWAWLLDDTEALKGLLARQSGRVVALAHYRIHKRPMSATIHLYVHDLYVTESCRRRGVGTMLMNALVPIAREAGCSTVYWHTREDNRLAQAFYDRFTERMTWVAYELDVG